MNARRRLGDFLLRKLWVATRSQIESAVVAGAGGIVFLGDSISHLGKWDLLFPDAATRNFGIAGERTEHLLQRLEPLIRLKPEKIFILIGTNDVGAGIMLDEIATNMERLLDRVRDALPDSRVYLQGVMPRQRKYAARVNALNQRYRAIAEIRGVFYIDLFPVFDDGTGKIRAEYTEDDLHLNGAGYETWRAKIAEFVNE